MRNAPKLVGWVGGKFGYWLSCSLCFPAKCMLLAIGCGFFVPKWVWLAYPRCGRGFRAVALCLAKIEPFYWPSDSSSTVIGPIKVVGFRKSGHKCTHAYTCSHTHTLTHTYAHKHKHTYTHSPIHTHIHSLTHIHTHHSYTCTHAHTPPTHAHSLTTHTHTHSLTHSRINTLTNTHPHTHTLTQGLKFLEFPYLLTLQLKRFDFDYSTMHRIKLNDRSPWQH